MFKFCAFICFIFITKNYSVRSEKIFDVKRFGAAGDGKKDDTKAFIGAWNEACKNGDSRILASQGNFIVGPVDFVGPCSGPVTVELDGTLTASSDADWDKLNSWIQFEKVDRLTIEGRGTLDGRGQSSWKRNDCHTKFKCDQFPVTLRLQQVTNSWINNIMSLNSKYFHFVVDHSHDITIQDVKITAPDDSPNTDGIHIGRSSNIKILDSSIATGDDCISLGPGSRDIEITEVQCGPGHGISIGSLGKYPNEDNVSGIVVRNCTIRGTENGLRIKTWASPLKGEVYNITYQDVFMQNVQNPIIIDQGYCPHGLCRQQVTVKVWVQDGSRIQIRDVLFSNIHGTSSSEVAVTLNCSSFLPCKNVNLKDIKLYNSSGAPTKSTCSNWKGSATGVVLPSACNS